MCVFLQTINATIGPQRRSACSADPHPALAHTLHQVRYRNLTRPRPSRAKSSVSTLDGTASSITPSTTSSTFAQSEWGRLRQIARRAHNDDTSDTDGEEGMSEQQLAAHRLKKKDAKRKREENARNMGLGKM